MGLVVWVVVVLGQVPVTPADITSVVGRTPTKDIAFVAHGNQLELTLQMERRDKDAEHSTLRFMTAVMHAAWLTKAVPERHLTVHGRLQLPLTEDMASVELCRSANFSLAGWLLKNEPAAQLELDVSCQYVAAPRE